MEERGRIPVTLPVTNPTESYWHEPPSKIANHRSTERLPESANTVIIGSGITGALIAWDLLEKGEKDVVMLEARTACGGASGRNGGHTKAASYRHYLPLSQSHGATEAAKVARLEYANIIGVHNFARDHLSKLPQNAGSETPAESVPCQTVDLVYDKPSFEFGKVSIAAIRRGLTDPGDAEGVAAYKTYSAADARSKLLAAGTDAEGNELVGAFEYLAGRVNAYKFVTETLELLVKRGVNLQTLTPVTGVLQRKGGKGGWSIQTSRGTIGATKVILATNGYTAHLFPKEFQGRIVPLRGHITAQRPGTSLPQDGLPKTYSFIYHDGYEYMIPRPLPPTDSESKIRESNWDIVIGGGLGKRPNMGAEEYGGTDDTTLNKEISQYLYACAADYYGSNWGSDDAQGRIKKEWTGIMGATADGAPFVGEMPGMKDLWVCAGFNGHGMALCLKCAEGLVGMMKGEKLEWFPDSFRLTQKRIDEASFSGRTDMKISTGPESVKRANL